MQDYLITRPFNENTEVCREISQRTKKLGKVGWIQPIYFFKNVNIVKVVKVQNLFG